MLARGANPWNPGESPTLSFPSPEGATETQDAALFRSYPEGADEEVFGWLAGSRGSRPWLTTAAPSGLKTGVPESLVTVRAEEHFHPANR